MDILEYCNKIKKVYKDANRLNLIKNMIFSKNCNVALLITFIVYLSIIVTYVVLLYYYNKCIHVVTILVIVLIFANFLFIKITNVLVDKYLKKNLLIKNKKLRSYCLSYLHFINMLKNTLPVNTEIIKISIKQFEIENDNKKFPNISIYLFVLTGLIIPFGIYKMQQNNLMNAVVTILFMAISIIVITIYDMFELAIHKGVYVNIEIIKRLNQYINEVEFKKKYKKKETKIYA